MMESPRWLVLVSNVGIGVAILGSIFLGVQVTHRLRTRVVVTPVPSLAQMADSARRAMVPLVGDTTGARARARSALEAVLPSTIGGAAPADSALREGQVALGRGRWGDAARAFALAARDTTSASAALGSSLLAAWRADEGTARTSLARALRLRATLSPPERLLLEAHQRWMAGDIRGSDSVYRALLTDVRDDPTLWYAASFVHRHDGGVIDSALIAYGSPVARSLTDQPTRRISHVGAIPALWRVLQLSPYHEAARLDLARFASLYDDRKLAAWLAWGAELYAVEPATRLAMRVIGADAKRDSLAWDVVRRLAANHPDPDAVFGAARALATSGGILYPLSLWHAAELLEPLTNSAKHPPAIVAAAHAWRGQLYFAVRRPVAARTELLAAAAIDSSVGLPLLAWTTWLSLESGDSALREERARLEGWSATADASGEGRDWLHPHRGMEPQLRSYGIGMLSAALGDTTRVLAEAAALDRMAPVAGDSTLHATMAAALRAEVAIARRDFAAAIAATPMLDGLLPPMWRDHSPFAGRIHARYRRAFAHQQSWQNEGARITYVSFFSPTLPELTIYRSARIRFDATP